MYERSYLHLMSQILVAKCENLGSLLTNFMFCSEKLLLMYQKNVFFFVFVFVFRKIGNGNCGL